MFSGIDESGCGVDAADVKGARKWILGIILIAGLCCGGLWLWQVDSIAVLVKGEAKPVPDPERYETLISEMQRWQTDLAEDYRQAKSADEKAAVERDARLILELMLPEMMCCWLGTTYDFNGTAEKPGEGKLACGYFVSTVLRDAGFRVNRYKLAQQPSENILRTFLPADSCQLRVGKDYDEYADWVEKKEPGIYLVGLDTHVGFIVNRVDGMRFFHSSAAGKVGVVNESREKAHALQYSNWRLLGGLTLEPDVIRTWLKGEKIAVKTS
ncbi:MAG: hypothetical protein NWT08_03240 [Akkermansiaceae bacterium]|nr:hypothetical protein [Akkermansiaceae bacterium]MDP4646455.1 hypothetical protein [Akkermansiaceae bacterium]MDP4720518.1 hypothetical protein [Akkermansiaceae bacterium]MDP4780062.1 hypothetical protein [Akkermansiaceae bacterium]MDP4847656.1 hypothetical protein [Akkermansiaceae bacterium]